MNFSEFEIAYAGKTLGVAVSPNREILALLRRYDESTSWSYSSFPLDKLRSVQKIVTQAEEFFGGGQRGAYGIGQNLGLAVRNRQARKRAEAQTGIELNLRSVDTPTFFVPISDEHDRDRLFEALQQVCESGSVNGRVNNISAARAKAMQENFVSPERAGDAATKYIPKDRKDVTEHGMTNTAALKLIAVIFVLLAGLMLLVG